MTVQTQPASPKTLTGREQMNIVVVGHVDHGKSTVIGRLLADTNSLPEGKLDAVREQCRRNAKPFEYAFLLDALKDEQAQGITIDSARCFFRSARREYIIIDAPGHIEFLKNMISGAARAEAGLLVIDAAEGVQENSRRHGYLASMLGITQLAVCINKMDLVDYDRSVFESIRDEYAGFLSQLGLEARAFIPISAREGDAIVGPSDRMTWYTGPSVLELLDDFEKAPRPIDQPLRLPVQDIYKFTAAGDDRRIVAGRVLTGSLEVGEEVVFQPSGKRSRVASIEAFNRPPQSVARAGESVGVTLETQIYIRPGEVLCRASDPQPAISTQVKANIVWLSSSPMIKDRKYKMKLAASRSSVWLTDIERSLDASTLTSTDSRQQIERHDVAVCTLETLRPVACDMGVDLPQTGRFVIIDNYEIAGGGVILGAQSVTNSLVQEHVKNRQQAWDRSMLTPSIRAGRYNQRATTLLITGPPNVGKRRLAKAIEEYLFNCGQLVYYLGVSNSLAGFDADLGGVDADRTEFLRRLGEIAHLFTDAGAILISSVSDVDDYELNLIRQLASPGDMLLVNVGESRFTRTKPDLQMDTVDLDSLQRIRELLQSRSYLLEYHL
jgi:bifunctional enzyme CysN/CysC